MRKSPASPSRRAFLKALTAGAASVSTSALGKPAVPHSLRIGVLLPDSTLYPRSRDNFLAGLRLAQANASSDEARGATLLIASAGRTPSQTVKAVDDLLALQQADVLVGMIGSNAAAEIKPLLAKHRRPFLTATMGANTVRVEERNHLTTAISLRGWLNAWEAGAWAVGRFGPRAVVMTSRYDSGYDHAFTLVAGIEAGGGELLDVIVTDDERGGHDFASAIERVRGLRPDVAVLLHSHPDALATLEQLDPDVFTDVAFVTSGPTHTGVHPRVATLTPWSPRSTIAENRDFVTRYEGLHGTQPDAFGLLGYETGSVLDSALRDGGYRHPRGFMEAVQRQGFVTPRGRLVQSGSTALTAPSHLFDPSRGWTRVELPRGLRTADANAAVDILHAAPRSGWLHDYLCV